MKYSLIFFFRFLKRYYSDAPAISKSNDADPALPNVADSSATPEVNDGGDQWDDEALAATLTKKPTSTAAASNTTELLDMKALDLRRNEEGDIVEKLRIEETRQKLAAAKEGMEKEALRLKEEREMKEQAKQDGVATSGAKPRFGAAAGMAGFVGSKWVPPHMRSGAGTVLTRERMGVAARVGSNKLDTQDENLFPDLAAASVIIEQQKQQQPAFKASKKTPVGGGGAWGSQPKKVNPVPPKAPEPTKPAEPVKEAKIEEPAKTEANSETPKAEASSAPAAQAPIKPTKKKKKDLSSFKA
jgi:hypothetical protein